MTSGDARFQNVFQALFVVLSSLSVFFLLFIFRFLDDNRLTSWKWAFAYVDVNGIIIYLLLGCAAAFLLSRSGISERYPVPFIFLSLFVTGIVFWQEPEMLVDTSRYFTYAKHLDLYGAGYFISEWGSGINVWTDLPLVPFLFGLVFKIFGESRVFIQFVTTLLFSLSGVITFYIGKELWNEQTGFSAGILLLGIPYLHTQVPLMLVDVPTMFFLALSVLCFMRALERGGGWIAVAAAAVFLTFYAKYSSWMMLSVLFAVFVVYVKHSHAVPMTVLKRAAATLILSVVFVVPVLYVKWDVFLDQIRFLQAYQVPGLRRWGESPVSTFFYQVHPFIPAAAIISVVYAVRKRDPKIIIVTWLILLVLVFRVRRARYILVVFPMLVLLAGYGLQIIKTEKLRKFIVYCAVATSLVVSICVYLPFLKMMSPANLNHAGEFLDTLEKDRVEVITLPAPDTIVNLAVTVPILDLYTGKAVSYRYNSSHLAREADLRESSLRFTWTYRNPGYYALSPYPPDDDGRALAVISNGPVSDLPADVAHQLRNYRKVREFEAETGIFRYRPYVTVYLPS